MLYYISFTGCEPTLNIPLIRYTLNRIQELKIKVYGFDIVTNGKDKDAFKEFGYFV